MRVLIAYLLYFYTILIFIRAIVEMFVAIGRWTPKGVAAIVLETIFTVTDPIIKLARKIIPPLRIGPVAVDMSIAVILLVFSIVTQLILRF